MAERVSAAKRIRARNLAEEEILRYRGDHAAWHKHVHNVELDAVQILKMVEMDEHRNTIDFSCRRTGKTAVKELHELEDNACIPDQELGIVAPREAQSLNNLDYHLEAIRRSAILSAFIEYKHNRKQLADTYYSFANRSKTQAYGIMSQVDGGDLTTASLEEVDDMPRDRLFSRFLLMMGATRRMGASKEARNDPTIRITGVFKGADTLKELIDSGKYHLLPTVNVYLGMEMGILNAAFMGDMREQLAPDEYIRQLLCLNVSARNLIWEKWVRRAMTIGLSAGLEIAQPMPGMEYKKRGLISFGYDHSGHGEDPQASKYALVVAEQIGNFTTFPFVKTWPPGTDEKIVEADIVSFWRYFRPDYAMGDAFGVGLITSVNDCLFREGLTNVDRLSIGEGESTASTWGDWAFSPIRFDGMAKHQMAGATRSLFNNGRAAIPYFEDHDMSGVDTDDMRLFTRQLPNIRTEQTKASYASYKMVKKKIGDDLFDGCMAAVWALVTRGVITVETLIETRKRTREQLLGQSPVRLPSDPITAEG